MLIQYSVENYRSISKKVTLSMVPAKGKSKLYNLIPVDNNPNIKNVLRSCVIYGANGSGKTNLLLALNHMRNMVLHSKEQNKGQPFDEYQPFLLDVQYSDKPTRFEVLFIKDDIEYEYSFSFNREKIVSEELSYYKGKKKCFFFKRNGDTLEPFIDHTDLLKLFEHTGENVLFISKANNEYKRFGFIYEWFDKNLETIGPLSLLPKHMTVDYMNQSEDNKQKILRFMRLADFDINNIKGQNVPLDDLNFVEPFKNFIKTVNSEIKKTKNNKLTGRIVLDASELKSVRKRLDGSEITVDFSEFESEGTNQFFRLASLWLESLQEANKVLIIDEFDIQLHPDLQYYLLKIFHDPEINKTKSQLIFSTHNTRILSTDFFRREQIWFTDKNSETQSTEINSLFDYEKRQDKSIEKGYLLGRYGGLPDLKYGKI
jgi:uncharacterized protein